MKKIIILTFLISLLFSCINNSETDNPFELIIKKDIFFNGKETFEKRFSIETNNTDSLWIIKTIVGDEIITRGYVKNEKFILTISDTSDTIGYQNDTFFDANFDGLKDYVIKYYSGTGCCPRDENRIFLYNKSTGTYKDVVNILNAYFDKKNRTVLLMDYGFPDIHMGITLSKNKWINDTLTSYEGIIIDKDSSFVLISYDTGKESKIKEVPQDYNRIPDIEWFKLK